MPKGLDTILGEGGTKLSGGEKQRLSIARALLRNPQILIFDEATASLDSLTEESITETINSLAAEKKQIIITIAHRLSTIMNADIIYVSKKERYPKPVRIPNCCNKRVCITHYGGNKWERGR